MRVPAFSAQMGLIETTRGLLPGAGKMIRGHRQELSQENRIDLQVISPAGGSQRLPRMVGITLAKELIFTGGIIERLTRCCERRSPII